ncbi:MAG: thioredoxin domain-containing protein [Anaerolineales bacterium]
MANRLENSHSPYLLQHADNPVHWYPWGPEALNKAKADDKPIFLSIGYAACHWCHVMAHESFEDSATASIMNKHFVNIKVDREQRPDVDSIYMDAVVAMTGQGGWPLSVFLTPAGEPFFGGTYFPPTSRHGLPSFRQVLEGIARSWREERDRLLSTGDQLVEHLRAGSGPGAGRADLDPATLLPAAEKLHQQYDWRHGGWGGAPKFPQPMAIQFLLARSEMEGDRLARDMALHSLRALAAGGIHDQLGGGFARYSVDRQWLVPHFEKMLYDNAQLMTAYLRAWQVTHEDEYLHVAESTLDFVMREMRDPEGCFYSSLDADSEGEEGKYYLWSLDQIRRALPDPVETSLLVDAYGVASSGHFEGKNILHRVKTDQELAEAHDLSTEQVNEQLAAARGRLLQERETRARPALDDKVVASWNGLMLRGLAIGSQATGTPTWLEAAQQLASFLLDQMVEGTSLKRTWRRGVAGQNAYLEDYAAVGLGLLELYAADFNPRWYQAAAGFAAMIVDSFDDPEWGFFDTQDDGEQLIARPKSVQDSPTPSGNAMAAELLLRIAALDGLDEYRSKAERAIAAMSAPMRQHPSAFASWLTDLVYATGPQRQLAIVGDPESDVFGKLAAVSRRAFYPDMVIAGGPAGISPAPALLADRPLLDGSPAAYLCRQFSCKRPTSNPAELQRMLAGET